MLQTKAQFRILALFSNQLITLQRKLFLDGTRTEVARREALMTQISSKLKKKKKNHFLMKMCDCVGGPMILFIIKIVYEKTLRAISSFRFLVCE